MQSGVLASRHSQIASGYAKREAQHWLGFFLLHAYQALPATFIRAAWVKSSMRLSGLIALGISAGST